MGDLLLQGFAQRLLSCVRPQDTVARLGGDEFAILLDDPEDAKVVAERIVRAMAEPFEMRGLNVQITVSVGAADHPTHANGAIAGRRASDLTAGIVPAASDRSRGSEPSTRGRTG